MNRSTFRTLIVLISLIATALPLSIATASDTQVTVDFEGLSGFVSSVSVGNGASATGGTIAGAIGVNGHNPDHGAANAALVFDSTCGDAADKSGCAVDADLYKPELGKILIVSADLNADEPNDADVRGAYLDFDFTGFGASGFVTVTSITLMDIEELVEDASLELTHVDGTVSEFPLPHMNDNEAKVTALDASGVNVTHMRVNVGGSGGIDNIKLTIPHAPDVSVAKAANPAAGSELQPGDPLSYSIEVSNSSQDQPANGVRITDTVDDEFTITAVSACDNGDGFDGRDIDCVIDVAAGGSTVVTVTGTIVDDPTDCSLSNTATVVFDDATPGNNTSNTVEHTILPVYCEGTDVGVTKAATPESGAILQPGDALAYTITVSNLTGADAADVVVTDEFDSEFVAASVDGCENDDALAGQSLSCELTVPAGASRDITVTGAVADDVDDCSLSNTATVTFEDDDATNNTSNTVRHTIDPVACGDEDVELTKVGPSAEELMADLGRDYVDVDDVVTYTISATNSGTGNADAVVITDEVDPSFGIVTATSETCEVAQSAGTVTCSVDRLAPGATVSMDLTVRVDLIPTAAPCSIPNQARVEWDGGASTSGAPFELPSKDETPDDPTDDCDFAPPPPAFAFAKTSQPADGTELEVGDTVTYVLTLEETTGLVAYPDAIVVRDTVSPDLTIQSVTGCPGLPDGNDIECLFADGLDVGEIATVTIVAEITSQPSDCFVENVAVANGTTSRVGHPVSPEECGTPEPRLNKSGPSVDDLSILFGRDHVLPGDVFAYAVTLDNDGDGPAYNVALQDDVHAALVVVGATGTNCQASFTDGSATCVTNRLAPGATATMAVAVRYELKVTDYPCQIPNSATASWGTDGVAALRHEPVIVNAKGWDTVQPGGQCDPQDPPPGLAFVKAATPGSGSELSMGDTVQYTLTLTETEGAAWPDAITIADTVSSYMTIDNVDNCPGYLPDGQTVECLFASGLGANASQTVTITARLTVQPPTTVCTVPNAATATSTDFFETSTVQHAVALACTGLDTESLSFALAFSMLAIGGVLLHATGGARRREGFLTA